MTAIAQTIGHADLEQAAEEQLRQAHERAVRASTADAASYVGALLGKSGPPT